MIRSILVTLLPILLVACSPKQRQVDRAIRDLGSEDYGGVFIVVSSPDPDKEHYIKLTPITGGDIEFQFPIKYAYLKEVSDPLIYDLEIANFPAEALEVYEGALDPSQLSRLEKFLSDEGIGYSVSCIGGRVDGDMALIAVMKEIKGRFNPDEVTPHRFVDEVFEEVYLHKEAPEMYTIATLIVEQGGADQTATAPESKSPDN